MTKINLIPEVKQREQKIQRVNALTVTVSLIVVIGVILIAAGFFTWNQIKSQRISSNEKKITKVNEELAPYEELEKNVLLMEKSLKEIKAILGGDKRWSLFFIELEKATPADVQIIKFDKTESSISMDLASRDVKGVDRFIKSFSGYKYNENNLFNNVKVNGYTRDSGTGLIVFKAVMELNSEILWQ